MSNSPTSISHFPKKNLGFFPTPLVELHRLSKLLQGPRIFIKRDDCTGLALGGNKTRKLEYLIGDALAQGSDCIITGGASQSNHCRQTAAAAALCGLECHLVLGGEAPKEPQGNLLLDILCGAHLHWSGELRKGERIPALAEELRSKGKKPYLIPYGGSNSVGALGFVDASLELSQQLAEMQLDVTHVVFASSSGGTQAGLTIGKVLTKADYSLIGIEIDKGETAFGSFRDAVTHVTNELALKLDIRCDAGELAPILRGEYVGAGYGVIGDLEREAIRLLASEEGILLDPVYSGRAFGGLLDMIRRGECTSSDTVVFWHTGGAPALFAYARECASC
jgi:L-cysteate sulfo-lyase